jgi:hypothetical protein
LFWEKINGGGRNGRKLFRTTEEGAKAGRECRLPPARKHSIIINSESHGQTPRNLLEGKTRDVMQQG